ncbi:MAG TPA: ribosome biogenesis/translation initiation ATPase RLI [Candidatus Nanoarchaeia archaeon]|nr:ribosome biogenesis/translation initiation ATPase RLI [Candidatus Nanoarchaeia archaeon]
MPKSKIAVIVEKEKCFPNRCGHECIKYDPINRSGGEGFHIGSAGKSEIDEAIVNEMHKICANKCPFQAIHIVKLPDKLDEEPIHRYGKNSFELFRLPIIKEDNIVGIIGRNGIGKSTALNILSGNLMPNLGRLTKKPDEREIIDKYSKSYLGEYFKKLFAKKIKVSYKPQRIELLPDFYKGTVKQLIKKVDEKGIGDELLKELQLDEQKEISKLSGGELQKAAIIACLARKSDVMFIDEPASFLDITSRIKVAKLIKEHSKGSSVMVVEHDLATLDYISDEIQVLYGEPACYGVLSGSKGVSRGINEYLDGYLPDDNVRFRDYKITFAKNLVIFQKPEPWFSYPSFTKTFPGFKLKVNDGILNKGQVLTIMGANGLGKTTFMKILAGLEKADDEEIENASISYKPQYIKAEDATVEEFLKEKAKKIYNSGWYKSNILEKLNIKVLLENNLKYLSGGELQKVYIASCLSEDAKILALDEPSAFIDVEDRLKVAEVIREFTQKKEVATTVIDHDVQFVDYLGDAMLVFEGVPGKEGHVFGPLSKEEGMNRVLKMLNITYRLDKETKRPRINKPDSQLDKLQRSKGKYYSLV